MNKVSSKLAAGVRKVKSQQATAPVVEKPVKAENLRDDASKPAKLHL